jgi:4,5-DOPA dioxygenase extradiol
MPLVYGAYVPNAPNLIDPSVFGGAGASTVASLRKIDLLHRFRPDAIVVVTPHWQSPHGFLVQGSASPRQIYDFSGFPPSLSSVRYRPPGDPDLARALVQEGHDLGVAVELTEDWGLDHGAWAPLLHLAPGGATPVVPVSIGSGGPDEHVRWGEAIGRVAHAHDRRIAVVGTGSILHRLDRFGSGAGFWPQGAEAEAEVVRRTLAHDITGLTGLDRSLWELLAPEGRLGPLFVVLGAVGKTSKARLVSTDQVFGAAGLSVLEFVPA